MTTPATPSSPPPSGDDRNLVPLDAQSALSFEDKLHLFWQNNRGLVFAICGAAILAILIKGGWEYFQNQKELDVEKAYASATTPEQLKAFAAAHASHSLAGIAQLRIADEAYAAGKAAEAVAAYDQAIATLKTGPLATRAQLGRALAKVQTGKAAEATAELKQLANDTALPNGVRAEAAYDLASLAVEAGNAADVQKYTDQLLQIDPSSPWAQRGMMLRATLPAPTVNVSATAEPAAKKDEGSPSIQLKLPGK